MNFRSAFYFGSNKQDPYNLIPNLSWKPFRIKEAYGYEIHKIGGDMLVQDPPDIREYDLIIHNCQQLIDTDCVQIIIGLEKMENDDKHHYITYEELYRVLDMFDHKSPNINYNPDNILSSVIKQTQQIYINKQQKIKEKRKDCNVV